MVWSNQASFSISHLAISNVLCFLFIFNQFGDISRELNERRKAWVTDLLGEDAAKNYKVGLRTCCFP